MKNYKLYDLSQPFGAGNAVVAVFPGSEDRAVPLSRQVPGVDPVDHRAHALLDSRGFAHSRASGEYAERPDVHGRAASGTTISARAWWFPFPSRVGQDHAGRSRKCPAQDRKGRHCPDQQRLAPLFRGHHRVFLLFARSVQGSRRVVRGKGRQGGGRGPAGAGPSSGHGHRAARRGAASPGRVRGIQGGKPDGTSKRISRSGNPATSFCWAMASWAGKTSAATWTK